MSWAEAIDTRYANCLNLVAPQYFPRWRYRWGRSTPIDCSVRDNHFQYNSFDILMVAGTHAHDHQFKCCEDVHTHGNIANPTELQ